MFKGRTKVELYISGIKEEDKIRYEFYPPGYPGKLLAEFKPWELVHRIEEAGKEAGQYVKARGDVTVVEDTGILDGVVATQHGGIIKLYLSVEVAFRVRVKGKEIIACNVAAPAKKL